MTPQPVVTQHRSRQDAAPAAPTTATAVLMLYSCCRCHSPALGRTVVAGGSLCAPNPSHAASSPVRTSDGVQHMYGALTTAPPAG